jgi:hypothetical protein
MPFVARKRTWLHCPLSCFGMKSLLYMIVPAIYETLLQEQRELDDFEEDKFWTKGEMLAYLDLKSILPSTVWNWMQLHSPNAS